jgi:Mg2+ and Co2+ transporter CorA
MLQSEAERLLAGARDLEESIGVSLSARRFEVNRLELTLSIASFAAALGAMVAGIFGMNLRRWAAVVQFCYVPLILLCMEVPCCGPAVVLLWP